MTTLKKRRSDRHHDQPAVTVYVTPTCQSCPKTLRVLRDHHVTHTIVDLTQDQLAYTYVTQELKYKAAPVVQVKHGWETTTWSGHHPDLINEHILQYYHDDTEEDRMAQAQANTTTAIRNSGLGNSTGPHLHWDTKQGGVINVPADRGVEIGEALQAEARRQQEG